MPAPSTIRRAAAYAARFGIPPVPAPTSLPVYPILVDDETQRRAASENLGRRLASRDRTPQDVLEALDFGAAR
ncbi:hypothetical protein Sa4125_29780 [Aureimonas sp. SA4125]|uniref:hypothetical protein n=1 Tax=Aureimonas sp. SA4125 TaxID=2826993 RepID=UPI001CC41B62|nr:hypothetical protein [Aureimonas sp. SA4125]BDA85436.1 hypothetical protein Sa4125_29780 [Aureimonas sp. SA4125]